MGRSEVLADWYTGVLVIPRGRQVSYVHMGYGSTYERYVLLEVLATHPWQRAAEVALFGDVALAADGAGQESPAERAVSDDGHTELSGRIEDLVGGRLYGEREGVVLGLQGRDGVDGVRPAQRVCAAVADLGRGLDAECAVTTTINRHCASVVQCHHQLP